MRNKILFTLFKLGQISSINRFYLIYYKLAYHVTRMTLLRLSFVDDAYLKGSFSHSYFVPVMSDLDFFLVGEKTIENETKLKNIFKLLNLIFPVVSDFDFHSHQDAQFLYRFGDFKYFTSQEWIVLKGKSIEFQYRYHPRKFYLDIINEIYFQLEWLFKNLKSRKPGDVFQTLKIQRQYDKIKDTLNYLHDHSSYRIRRRRFKPNYRWCEKTNEGIIRDFNNLIWKNIKLQELAFIIAEEFADRDIEKILQEPYYRNELTIIDDGFVYSGQSHYLSSKLFALFYYSGCIDSFLAYDWAISKTKDKISSLFLRAQYYCKLIENRASSKHNYQYWVDQSKKTEKEFELIQRVLPAYSAPPANFFGSSVIVIPYSDKSEFSPGQWKDKLPLGLEMPINTVVLFVCHNHGRDMTEIYSEIKIGDQKTSFCTLHVYDHYTDPNIDHMPTLYKYGVSWCFGANKIMLFDRDLVLDQNCLDHFLKIDYADLEFGLLEVTPSYSQPFLLASKAENIRTINFDHLYSWDVYNFEKLLYTLGHRTNLDGENANFIFENFEALNSLGIPSTVKLASFKYTFFERDVGANSLTMMTSLKRLLCQDKIGFLEPKEESLDTWHELGYLLSTSNFFALSHSLKMRPEYQSFINRSIFGEKLPGIFKKIKGCIGVITDGSDQNFNCTVLNSGVGEIQKELELDFEYSCFYLIRASLEFLNSENKMYIDSKIAIKGYEHSGTSKNFFISGDPSSELYIVYAPAGKQRLIIDLRVDCEEEGEFSFRINKVAALNKQLMDRKDIPSLDDVDEYLGKGNSVFMLEAKSNSLKFDIDEGLRTSNAIYPVHYDVEMGVSQFYCVEARNNEIDYGSVNKPTLGESLSLFHLPITPLKWRKDSKNRIDFKLKDDGICIETLDLEVDSIHKGLNYFLISIDGYLTYDEVEIELSSDQFNSAFFRLHKKQYYLVSFFKIADGHLAQFKLKFRGKKDENYCIKAKHLNYQVGNQMTFNDIKFDSPLLLKPGLYYFTFKAFSADQFVKIFGEVREEKIHLDKSGEFVFKFFVDALTSGSYKLGLSDGCELKKIQWTKFNLPDSES